MKKLLPFLVLVVFLTACSSTKKSSGGSAPVADQSTMISRNNDSNDGSSYEKAIVIEEKSEKKGVDAEYAWLRQNYPGCRVGKQALNFKDKKPYDILTITTAEGETRQIYFDISNFFGKF